MKKRNAKRLQTCPGCGKRGILSFKSHKCKKGKALAKTIAVEIVSPPAESLQEIEKCLTPVVDLIERKSVDLLYDIITAGLYLMKAQDVHRCATVAHAADGKFESGGDTGFQGWLEEKYPHVSRRSAYNYINGAKNCGLTIHDDAGAIDALRKTHALKGKTAGDLYKLKDKEEEDEQGGGTKWSLIRDALVNVRESCETGIELMPRFNKKVHSTFCARLLRTLEEATGSTWDIVPRRKENRFREHGDVYEIGS